MTRAAIAGQPDWDMLLHTHGIGEIDFSSMSADDLPRVQSAADLDGVCIMPTAFLRRSYMSDFERVLIAYSTAIEQYPAVVGFAVEGPLLGRTGGVPPAGCWAPSVEEWRRIAGWGDYGLRYMVIGPDAIDIDDELGGGFTFRELIDLFYAKGVILALGHFQHSNPELSARRTAEIIEYVYESFGHSADMLITDHLFNDMPRNFVHAWRTSQSRLRRDEEIRPVLDEEWTESNIGRLLGPVPGTLLFAARANKLTPVLNFDGEHVDLEICRLVVDFLGPGRLMAITDNTDLDILAGEPLHSLPGSSLKYRADGVVAAGSCGLESQRRRMSEIGLSAVDIDQLVRHVPHRVFTRLRRSA